MREVTTVAIDLAKSVFQVHAVNEHGMAKIRRQVRRAQLMPFVAQLPPCTIAMEACASAHYWGRQFQQFGHQVKLIPPQYVKPFVRGHKTDRNDAEAICEAALRPRMPQVALKSQEQQGLLSLHRLRVLLEKQRKQLANQLRGLLGEFGLIAPQGVSALRKLLPEAIAQLPILLQFPLRQAHERLIELERQCAAHNGLIEQLARAQPVCRRLMREPGVGPLSASAFLATLGDPTHFRNGRQVAASLGLVPRQHSSGGKTVLLSISKRGDKYLRTLLIHGARAVFRHAPGKTDPLSLWVCELARRRGTNRAVVALANKNARRLWAIWRAEGPSLRAAAVAA